MNDLRVTFPKPCNEKWGEMQPVGCNRLCERCEHIVHDLAQLTVDQAEALLAPGQKICVRAKLGASGEVELKSNSKAAARRMVAIVGTSVGLLAASSQAAAAARPPAGVISGKITGGCGAYVTAIAADGREFVAKIRLNGRYKFKHLPDGAYELVVPYGADDETFRVGRAVIQAGGKTLLDAEDPSECIVVGQMLIGDASREG